MVGRLELLIKFQRVEEGRKCHLGLFLLSSKEINCSTVALIWSSIDDYSIGICTGIRVAIFVILSACVLGM